jgi:hypothetical protein
MNQGSQAPDRSHLPESGPHFVCALLDANLDTALGALDDVYENNNVAAIGSLNAFINAVEAQRGTRLRTLKLTI